MDALDHLLRAPTPREPIPSLDAWIGKLATCPLEIPIDRALWAGYEADRLGYAFVGGYRAALARLFDVTALAIGRTEGAWPIPPMPDRISLCATETGGAHPSAIATRLEKVGGEMFLRGEKTYATLASVADELLVVASRGIASDGKNRLRLVRVRPRSNGLTIRDREPAPFAPEVPHAVVTLVNVLVTDADVLPGDAYMLYLKPFRTIEDAHVLASTLGYVIRAARTYGFSHALVEGAFSLALALRHVASMTPLDATTHIALAGLFHAGRQLLTEHEADWEKADPETRNRWRRDIALLQIAENARQKRTEAAWRALAV
jgi:acyl-CoA dehydrogenase